MNEPEPQKGGFGPRCQEFSRLSRDSPRRSPVSSHSLCAGRRHRGRQRVNSRRGADKVDPICSEATDDIRAIPISQTVVAAADGPTIADYLRQVAAIVRDVAVDVRAIEAPAEDQANVDRMTALLDQQADGMDALTPDLLAGNGGGTEHAPARREIQSARAEAEALASSLGVTACAQGVQPLSISSPSPDWRLHGRARHRLAQRVGADPSHALSQKSAREILSGRCRRRTSNSSNASSSPTTAGTSRRWWRGSLSEIEWHSGILAGQREGVGLSGTRGLPQGDSGPPPALSELHLEYSQIWDLGDRVLGVGRIRARGWESGAETESASAGVAEFKEGKVTRIAATWTRRRPWKLSGFRRIRRSSLSSSCKRSTPSTGGRRRVRGHRESRGWNGRIPSTGRTSLGPIGEKRRSENGSTRPSSSPGRPFNAGSRRPRKRTTGSSSVGFSPPRGEDGVETQLHFSRVRGSPVGQGDETRGVPRAGRRPSRPPASRSRRCRRRTWRSCAACGHWTTENLEASIHLLDEGVEPSGMRPSSGTGPYRGHDGGRKRNGAEQWEVVSGLHHEMRRSSKPPIGETPAAERTQGRMRHTDMKTNVQWATTWTIRDGKSVLRAYGCLTRTEVLEAAGLRSRRCRRRTWSQ